MNTDLTFLNILQKNLRIITINGASNNDTCFQNLPNCPLSYIATDLCLILNLNKIIEENLTLVVLCVTFLTIFTVSLRLFQRLNDQICSWRFWTVRLTVTVTMACIRVACNTSTDRNKINKWNQNHLSNFEKLMIEMMNFAGWGLPIYSQGCTERK